MNLDICKSLIEGKGFKTNIIVNDNTNLQIIRNNTVLNHLVFDSNSKQLLNTNGIKLEKNECSEYKEEDYLGNNIVGFQYKWEEFNVSKYKWESKKVIGCKLHRKNKKNSVNLGQCNDGSNFTAINQAINQAKEFVNICNEKNW